MSKHTPIEIAVPQPWLWIGRVFFFALTAIALLCIWILVYRKDIFEDIFILNAFLLFTVLPIIFVFFLPFFIGRYPAWVVRLVGEPFLHRLINDCRVLLGTRRINQAELAKPNSWFQDKRIIWLIIVVGALILGIWHGTM
jgi:hypothetical protein